MSNDPRYTEVNWSRLHNDESTDSNRIVTISNKCNDLKLPQSVGNKTYYTKEQVIEDLKKLQEITLVLLR